MCVYNWSGKDTQSSWSRFVTFDSGIRKTVRWYLDNPEWVQGVQSGAYREWVAAQYGHEGADARTGAAS